MRRRWQLLIVVFLLGGSAGYFGRDFDFGASSDLRSKAASVIANETWIESRRRALNTPPPAEDPGTDPGLQWNGPTGGMKPCNSRSKICFLLAEENR